MHNSYLSGTIQIYRSTRSRSLQVTFLKVPPHLWLIAAAFILVFFYAAPAFAQLDTIVVTGSRVKPYCTGSACRQALEDLARDLKAPGGFSTKPGEKPDPVEIEVTQEQLCKAIKARQPAGCTSLPVIFSLNGAPAGNGCGSGATDRALGDAALRVLHPFTYTGDIDAPYRNINFLAACNAHDTCYATQGGFATCNTNFQSAVYGACSLAAVVADCNSIAANYVTAVNSSIAENIYKQDTAALTCFRYQNDAARNGCTP